MSTNTLPLAPSIPAFLETPTNHKINGSDEELINEEETHFRPHTVLREKLVIVGDETVGKTSIVQMLTTDGADYPKDYVMTTEVNVSVKEMEIPNQNATVDLFLYDMAGQSIFNQVGFFFLASSLC